MLGPVGPTRACERPVVSRTDEPRICVNTPNLLPFADRHGLALREGGPFTIAPSILIALTILPS